MAVKLMLPQYIDPTMLVAGGSGTLAMYPASRMWLENPRWPTRSDDCDPPNALGSTWYQVFDAGENRRFVMNTLASIANNQGVTVAFNPTNAWNSPAASVGMGHIIETIPVASLSASGPRVMRLDGVTWQRHALIGTVVRSSLGADVVISDNSEETFWVQGTDMTAIAGYIYLLTPRTWRQFTRVEYRYMRVSIGAVETTPSSTFDLLLSGGLALTLGDQHRLRNLGKSVLPGTEERNKIGSLFRKVDGPLYREWELQLTAPTEDEESVIEAMRAAAGRRPWVLIPDSDNPYYWDYVFPDFEVGWDLDRTVIGLRSIGGIGSIPR